MADGRHSFRNLLSLLKRPHKPDPVVARQHVFSRELPLLPTPLDDAQRPLLSRSHSHFGALLYFSASVWTPCTIALQHNTISVSWEGHSKDISLVGCSDIRSVSSEDEELKVFELSFKSPNKKERFAVSSVRERAKWISAFWDAILPSSPTQHAESKHPRGSTDRSLPPIPSPSRILPSTPKVKPKPIFPSKSKVSFDDTVQIVESPQSMSRTPTSRTLPIPPPISPLSTSTYSSGNATGSASRSRFSADSSTLPVPPSSPTVKGTRKKWPPPVSRWASHSQSSSSSDSGDAAANSENKTKDMEKESPLILEAPTPKRISMFTKIPLDADGVPSHIRASSSHATPIASTTWDTPNTPITPLRPPNNTPVRSTPSGSSSSSRVQVPSRNLNRVQTQDRGGGKGEGINPGTKSVSIANLSKLSVVRTRLAAMESQSSSPSSHSSSHATSNARSSQSKPSTPIRETGDAGEGKGTGGSRSLAPDGLPAPSTSALSSSPPPTPSKGPSTTMGLHPYPERDKGVLGVLKGLESKVDRVGGAIESVRVIVEGIERSRDSDSPLHAKPREDAVQKELAKIQAKLQEMHQPQRKTGTSTGAGASTLASPEHSQEVSEKLDALERVGEETQTLVRGLAATSAEGARNGEGKGREVLTQLTNLQSLLEASHAQHAQQGAQHADSVRYLNELNGWLEAFVSNPPSEGYTQGQAGSVMEDVKQLVRVMKARDQNMATLQASVNDLVVGLRASSGHGTLDANALAHMIEGQRREQEAMLRVFTDEISDEIKGERLRFVEAMKEATAINVQHHVDELKKEMGKEVFVMAREVERLHRDKQDVEQRIAELMAFYSKQTINNNLDLSRASTTGNGAHASQSAGHSSSSATTGFHNSYRTGTVAPGMLALSSEPTYMPQHPQVDAGYDFDSAKGSGLESRRSHLDYHNLQAPSSSLDSRLQQQQHYTTTAASRYQGTSNGIGGVGGAGPGAAGVRSSHTAGMKPVMDLRMKPLGSGRRGLGSQGGTPTPSSSRVQGARGRGLYPRPSQTKATPLLKSSF